MGELIVRERRCEYPEIQICELGGWVGGGGGGGCSLLGCGGAVLVCGVGGESWVGGVGVGLGGVWGSFWVGGRLGVGCVFGLPRDGCVVMDGG